MKGKGWSSWPDITNDQIKSKMPGLPQGTAVAVITYAGDLFSWNAGSVEADVYFCPERHGMYFGGFGLKTAPAMGKQDYSISTSLTGVNKDRVLSLSKRYGELDGEMLYFYATAFAEVGETLTAPQKEKLAGMRASNPSDPKGPFLYSSPINLPKIENTDFLFGVPRSGLPTFSSRARA